MEIYNRELYEALKAYTRRAIRLIKELKLEEKVPQFSETRWQKTFDGYIRRIPVATKHWGSVFYNYRSQFHELIEKELNKTESIQKRFTPLSGFSSNRRKIRLNDKVEICKLKSDEIIFLLEKGFVLGNEFMDMLSNHPEYAIVVTYEIPFTKRDSELNKNTSLQKDFYENISIEYQVINSLRLFKKAAIVPLGILFFEKTIFVSSQYTLYWNHPPFSPEPTYLLNGNEVSVFMKLWSMVEGAVSQQGKKSLKVAVNRFGQALDKRNWEDKVIDFSIAAEALFLNGAKSELTYKLALRAACFLEKDAENKEESIQVF